MRPALRILDAAANRAREACRVMEDVARFTLDDAALTESLKTLRHDLRAALAPADDLLPVAHRDTPEDVGTTLTTNAESARADLPAVARAAGARLTEALRSLEETAKTLHTDAPAFSPAQFESLRYRAYALDRQLALALAARPARFRLCVLLTESLCAHHDWLSVARLAAEAGADCLQLREKDLDDAELLRRAIALVDLARSHPGQLAVIINDRPDIALLARTDGVHLGQADLTIEAVRQLAGRRLLVGVSTADLDQARAARSAGADYCGVGPMFASATKAKPSLAGPAYLRAYLAEDPPLPPPLAISGITLETLPALLDAADGRPFGIAVSAAICAAKDPAAATHALLERLPAS